MVYVGLDVHRKRTQVAIIDDAGTQLLNRSVLNDRAELVAVLGPLPAATPIVFEAAYGWGWLAELLEELGFQTHMAHPGRCKAIASGRLKTDKVDARTLAHLLRTDLLPQAWIAPSEIRDLRQLLRARVALVRLRVSLQARIHAVLADRGVLVDRPLWKTPGRLWLSSLELPAPQRMLIDRFSALIDQINEQIRALEGELADRARPDPRIKALMELPGIGSFTALLLVAEIGDIARFPTARKLCSWAGLTPVVRNSAETVRHGHITKEGSAWVRWALVESAQIAKSREPFSRPYAQISRRRGKNIATVAIARKLLARCFYVLKGVNDASTLLEEVSVSDELEV